ncbi:metallophosphoesterase family protein [Paenibacillus sedimenti]|uniref:Metallophosphoesterase family protein n=1 Tax=Paenibacillus sedimenti TaxID=2770274 RepID=A0A926KPL2_9BACL|nr:metallophosphoesterase family protein [Paenibacillus sedimenti]MBD0381157.1 metallophosphoesterase family protein [Paenibacillus sedimenti]
MEKIAIISDIHGNMPALDAVLYDIDRRGIRRIICLGDLVGKGPGSAEAVDRTRDVCETVVQGNWDIGITYPQDQPAGLWHQQQLGEERLAYLAQLPFSVDLHMSGKLIRLFHASAQSVFHRVKRKAPKEERLAMFQNTEMTGIPYGQRQPDIVGYGDIHLPYLLTIKNPPEERSAKHTGDGRILFNAGSVGTPYDGIPQASYCVLEGEAESPAVPAGISIQFVRVPYDIGRAVQLAYAAEMPESRRYELEITTGLVHK